MSLTASLAGFVGALFGTFLFTRLVHWLTKRWRDGYPKIFMVYAAVGVLALAVDVWTFNGWELRRAIIFQVAALVFFLLIDLEISRGREASEAQSQKSASL
jgi:MFS family permease